MADQRDRRRRPKRGRRTDAGERPSPVPGPGTEGGEEGFHDIHQPEERRPDTELYNVSPPDMPPSAGGANADIGGEAAASRRLSGLPPDIARRPEHQVRRATPGREPFLGYDGYDAASILGWITDADPNPDQLMAILRYERAHRRRPVILDDCRERLRRFRGERGRSPGR